MNSTKKQEKNAEICYSFAQENHALMKIGTVLKLIGKISLVQLILFMLKMKQKHVRNPDLVTSSSNAFIESKEDFLPIAEEFES